MGRQGCEAVLITCFRSQGHACYDVVAVLRGFGRVDRFDDVQCAPEFFFRSSPTRSFDNCACVALSLQQSHAVASPWNAPEERGGGWRKRSTTFTSWNAREERGGGWREQSTTFTALFPMTSHTSTSLLDGWCRVLDASGVVIANLKTTVNNVVGPRPGPLFDDPAIGQQRQRRRRQL